MASSSSYEINNACCRCPDAPLIENCEADYQTCSQCGLTVGSRDSEWSTPSNDKNGTALPHIGNPENSVLSGSKLTAITPNHNNITPEVKLQFWYEKCNFKKRLHRGYKEINSLVDHIKLPSSIGDMAKKIFKRVYDRENLMSFSSSTIASACLYIVCRQERVPTTFNEICAVSKMSHRKIAKCFKFILVALDISLLDIRSDYYISTICSNLGLPNIIARASTHIAKRAVDLHIVPSESPSSIAAAAIYMASQVSEDKKSQKEVEDMSDVAICQSYKLMHPYASQLFPPDFKFAIPIEKLPLYADVKAEAT